MDSEVILDYFFKTDIKTMTEDSQAQNRQKSEKFVSQNGYTDFLKKYPVSRINTLFPKWATRFYKVFLFVEERGTYPWGIWFPQWSPCFPI